MVDFIEERILVNQFPRVEISASRALQKAKEREGEGEAKTVAGQESEYLIFERHFEKHHEGVSGSEGGGSGAPIDAEPFKFLNNEEDMNTEELGIIDLEDDDLFDNIDDEKLPVLKNTYNKKNRPNNSKSLAAGSKSKANKIDHGAVGSSSPAPDGRRGDREEPTKEEELAEWKPIALSVSNEDRLTDRRAEAFVEGEESSETRQPVLPPVESIEGIERVEFEDEEEEEIIFSEVNERLAEERSSVAAQKLSRRKKELLRPFEQRIMIESPPKQPLQHRSPSAGHLKTAEDLNEAVIEFEGEDVEKKVDSFVQEFQEEEEKLFVRMGAPVAYKQAHEGERGTPAEEEATAEAR